MKGRWKAYSQVIGDSRLYIAGRQLDLSQPVHGGNIEYSGDYSEDRDAVNELCNKLNEGSE